MALPLGHLNHLFRSGGRVVGVSASKAVELGVTPSRVKPGVFNLFCVLYPLLIEKSIIYPQCNTFIFLILKIEVCFSLYFRKFTPR